MEKFNYKNLDSILHSRIRLAIISFLSGCKKSDFTTIKKTIGASDGNLTTHLRKLEEAQYILMRKEFIGRKPITFYTMTKKGLDAFIEYISSIKNLLANDD